MVFKYECSRWTDVLGRKCRVERVGGSTTD